MQVAHIYGTHVPTSLDSLDAVMRSTALMAAMQAISAHTDVVIYGTTDSPIIEETAKLAKRMNIPEDDIRFTESDFGPRVEIKNASGDWGSLTLRAFDKSGTNPEGSKDTFKALYDRMIEDETRPGKSSDIVDLHQPYFSGYVKQGGVNHAVMHLHGPLGDNAEAIAHYFGDALTSQWRINKDGILIPSQPSIALSRQHMQDSEAYGADILGYAYHGVIAPDKSEVTEERARGIYSILDV